MDDLSWLRHSVQIAQAERRRSRRKHGHSSVFRAVIAVILIGIAVGSGFGAYILGIAVQRGQVVVPLETMRAAAAAVFLTLLIGVVSRTSRLRERINTDHLLTTVSASEVVLGVILAVASQIAIPISLIVVGVAVGFALGVGSLAGTFTIIIAVAGLFAFAATFGVGVSFLIKFIATRSPRFRRYRTALGFAAAFLVFAGYNIAQEGAVPIDFLLRGLTAVPIAWFVDLGLLGISGVQSSLLRSMGALVVVVGGVPALVAVTTTLATWVWETEPVSATMLHRTHSLIGEGIAERLFAERVSRPVLTIARKRWLQERRIPVGLLMTGYVYILSMAVIIPAGVAGEIPGLSLVVLVYMFGAGTGLAFGLMVISTEYSSLSMTLTTVSGEQFIRGELLAGIAVSVPATAVVTALLAIISPLSALEMLLFVVCDVVLCICGAALALVIGMRVSHRILAPMPIPFTNAVGYDEYGYGSPIRAGLLLGLLALVCIPALGGYVVAFLDIHATVFGINIAAVRVWLLLLTIIVAIGVFPLAYRRAVRLYDQYEIS